MYMYTHIDTVILTGKKYYRLNMGVMSFRWINGTESFCERNTD